MPDAFAAEIPGGDNAGRDRWLQKSTVDPLDRIPFFAEAMAAAAGALTESFCGLSASEGEYAFKGLSLTRVDALPRKREALPIFAALRASSWETALGLWVDRAFVSTVIEAFFGGGGDEAGPVFDHRPVSPIEARIVDVIGGQAAAALTFALKDIAPVKIDFDRTMPKPEASFLGRPPTPLLVATFALQTIGRNEELDLLIPQAAIDARSSAFGGGGADAPVPDGATWARQLRSEVSRATLRVEAAIPMRPISLGAVADLRVGQVLELPANAGSMVLLSSGEETLFRCHLGQSAGCYTVRVDEALDRDPQPPRKGR